MIINKGKYLEFISLPHYIQIFKIVIDFTSFIVSLVTFIRGKNMIYFFPGPLDNLLMPNIMDKKVIKSIESAV